MGNTTDRVLGSNNQYNAVFTDKKDNSTMEHMDFLKLMIAQMQNQDFTNPMDNSQMITQMTQFSNMQMMQEMASYSKTNYAISLVGKNVTASRFTVSGELETTSGPVQKVSLVDNEYVVYVGGKKYTMDQIMSVESGSTGTGTDGAAVDPSKMKPTISEIDEDSAFVEWKVPTEDDMTAAELKYAVYYSKDKEFGTVEQVEKGTLAGNVKAKDKLSMNLTDLDSGTTYYVNVVVTDGNGKKAVYSAASFKTFGEAPPDLGEDTEDSKTKTDTETKTGSGSESGTENKDASL